VKAKGKHSGRIEADAGATVVANAKAAWRSAWEAACSHDNIDPSEKFVVFSDDNPFVPYIGKAFDEFVRFRDEYLAGGYVGLELGR